MSSIAILIATCQEGMCLCGCDDPLHNPLILPRGGLERDEAVVWGAGGATGACSLQQREVTWFGVSFCVWDFGAHTNVCARVCAVQCVERIVRAARRPRSVWRGADLLNMNKLGVRVRSHTTSSSYTREQPSARTTAQKSTAQYFPRRYTAVFSAGGTGE